MCRCNFAVCFFGALRVNVFFIYSGFLQLKWTNLDPLGLVRKMKDQFPDGESMEQALVDAGISSAYQEKPCIDPNDEDCPDTAPNKQSRQVGKLLLILRHVPKLSKYWLSPL